MAAMQRGTIKKLVADKGFGFISGSNGAKDLFFHVSALKDTTFESLYEGQDVEFESETGPKGARASVVKPV
jgi:CspA family cold shock protein